MFQKCTWALWQSEEGRYGVDGQALFVPAASGHDPLQYYCLEDPRDREACWVVVHGFIKLDITE